MIKRLLLIIFIISLTSCSKEVAIAQIGAKVPNYTFSNVLNSEQNDISLNDLEGKLVILEFWATWCGPCIPAMKKLDSLQRDFENDIEVITISNEKEERLKKFISSTNTSLKIVSDTIHQSVFQYNTIPHSIIIDKEGIVRAITSPGNITKEVIHKFLASNIIDLEVKDDFFKDPDLEVKTLKSVTNSNYVIELKNYNQENRGGSQTLYDLDGNINGMKMTNSTVPRLYQNLFDIASPLRMKFRDGLSYNNFPYEPDHQYNFLIQASENYQSRWKSIGVEFLNEQFDANARMATERLDCYVLINIDDTIQESNAESPSYMFMGPIFKAKKIKMSQLAEYLENFTDLPVLDKTNLSGVYDVELEWQEEDPKTLHTELKKYGLQLERSEGKLPVDIMEIYLKK